MYYTRMPANEKHHAGSPGRSIAALVVNFQWGDNDLIHVTMDHSVQGGQYQEYAHLVLDPGALAPLTPKEVLNTVLLALGPVMAEFSIERNRAIVHAQTFP